MHVHTWQEFLKRLTGTASSPNKPRRNSQSAYYRPRLEGLEQRLVFSSVSLLQNPVNSGTGTVVTSSATNAPAAVNPPAAAPALGAPGIVALLASSTSTAITGASCTETGVTITVQVSGTSPTGNVAVDFYDTDLNYVGTAVGTLNASGVASATMPLTSGTYSIVASYGGDANNDPSVSPVSRIIDYQVTCTPGGGVGILLLKQCGTAITSTSDGSVKVTGGDIVANTSSATEAKITRPGSSISDTDFSQSGPYAGGVDGGATMADPLAALVAPAMGVLQSSNTLNISGNAVVTLQPGRYIGGINISGNANVTLAPGIYYLDGGGFHVSGKATVTGDNVMLYNAATSSRCGITGGDITFSSSGDVHLTGLYGPNAGVYDDIAIFQDRRLNTPITLSGSGDVFIVGKVYAAAATVKIKGDGSLIMDSDDAKHITAQLIAYDLLITGTVTTCSKTSTCFGGKPSNCSSYSTNCYSNYSKNNCYSYSTNCYNSKNCYSYSTNCYASYSKNSCGYSTSYCSSSYSSKGGCNTGCGSVCTTVPAKGGVSVNLGNMGGACTCSVVFVE